MAQAIFAQTRPDNPPVMEPVPTSAFPTPARRALNAVLDTARMQEVFSLQLRPWQEALEDVVAQLSGQKETA
jgi:dTDP-4-dehydrorhamnose reductase